MAFLPFSSSLYVSSSNKTCYTPRQKYPVPSWTSVEIPPPPTRLYSVLQSWPQLNLCGDNPPPPLDCIVLYSAAEISCPPAEPLWRYPLPSRLYSVINRGRNKLAPAEPLWRYPFPPSPPNCSLPGSHLSLLYQHPHHKRWKIAMQIR